MREWVQADHALFFVLNGASAHAPVREIAEALSEFGRYAVALLALLVLALAERADFRRHLLAVALVAVPLFGLSHALKTGIDRARPMGYYRAGLARGAVTIHGRERLRKRSFPSGHSLLAFYALGYVALMRRRHAAWALALAAAVAWSRVATGAHFPFDCVVGGGLGLAGAWMARRVFRHLRNGAPAPTERREAPASG